MIPYELKRYKDGILYYEENDILRRRPLSIDKRESRYEKYYQNIWFMSVGLSSLLLQRQENK